MFMVIVYCCCRCSILHLFTIAAIVESLLRYAKMHTNFCVSISFPPFVVSLVSSLFILFFLFVLFSLYRRLTLFCFFVFCVCGRLILHVGKNSPLRQHTTTLQIGPIALCRQNTNQEIASARYLS